jgi:hypothetical protein
MEGMTTNLTSGKTSFASSIWMYTAQHSGACSSYQMFTGDGGEIHNSEDDNSDAGAGNGVVEQMIPA